MNAIFTLARQFKSWLLLLLCLLVGLNLEAQVIYVNSTATGNNDGTSWTDAYTDLQTALSNSTSGDDIWIAAGTYKPHSTDRSVSFDLKGNVDIYGGFPTTGTPVWDDRDPETYLSILSGDINTLSDNSDNSYHVLYANSITNCTLDGLTISDGNSNDHGGGLYNSGSTFTINNCIFTNNTGDQNGGAIYNTNNADMTITNCQFINNGDDTSNNGGAIYNDASSPSIESCTFEGNLSQKGGGMFNQAASPTINTCTFNNNNTRYASNHARGGAITNEGGSEPTITACKFIANTATSSWDDRSGGGAVYSYESAPQIENCQFENSITDNDGGAIYIQSGIDNSGSWSYPSITNCTFTANSTDGGGGHGGGVFIQDASPTISDCSFINNRVRNDRDGGAIYVTGTGIDYSLNDSYFEGHDRPVIYHDNTGISITIDGCDFTQNTNICIDNNSTTTGSIKNCTFSENYASEGAAIHNSSVSSMTIEDCQFMNHTIGSSSSNHYRGPLYNDGGTNITVNRCVFTGNSVSDPSGWSGRGGAFSNNNASPTITSCSFYNNSASDDGGAIYNSGTSTPSLSNCVFDGNSANHGGAFYGTDATFSICTFVKNTATNDGGALEINNGTTATIDQCEFEENSSQNNGGAILMQHGTLTECLFINNLADNNRDGGAIYIESGSAPTIKFCRFYDNTAGDGGGLYFNGTNSMTLEHCLFSGNTALRWGGGAIRVNNNKAADITNCTFYANQHSGTSGGGGAIYSEGDINLTNNIMWANTSAGAGSQLNISYATPNTTNITNCVVENGEADIAGTCTSYSNNKMANPRFVDADGADDTPGTLDDDPTLKNSSKAVNAGNDAVTVGAVDLAGNTRRYAGSTIDIGAYECQSAATSSSYIYVDDDATGDNDGSSWSNAFTNLQDALDYAESGEEIWVAAGTYMPGTARTDYFALKNDIDIYGGLNGSEDPSTYDLDNRNFTTNESILSAEIQSDGDATNNCYHVLYNSSIGSTAVLDGFTISGGYANGSNEASDGGGMYNDNASPSLKNCSLKNNYANDDGGGIYNDNSNPTFTACQFSGNEANDQGGAAYINTNSGTFTNCQFSSNTATYGGAVYSNQASPTLDTCQFTGNTATDNGGAAYNNQGSPDFNNCQFTSNTSTGSAGAAYNTATTVSFEKCYFQSNQSGNDGGAIFANSSSNLLIDSCTFLTNRTIEDRPRGGAIFTTGDATVSIHNSYFFGNVAEDNNATDNDGGGGAVFFQNNSVLQNHSITQSVFSGNEAQDGGGGAIGCNGTNNSISIKSSTFYGNKHLNTGWKNGGGAIWLYNSGSSMTVSHCIFFANSSEDEGQQIFADQGTFTIDYSMTQNGQAAILDGGGLSYGTHNTTAAPHFTDGDGADDVLGTADDDLSLKSSTHMIDAGDPSLTSANIVAWLGTDEDLAGTPRLYNNGTIDIGAYEYQGAYTQIPIYVNDDATGAGDGSSWTDALTNLYDGMSAAIAGEEVWVAGGSYKPDHDKNGAPETGQDATFPLKSDISIYGSFIGTPGTEGTFNSRDFVNHQSVLSGDLDGNGTDAGDSRHLIYANGISNSRLDGFVITQAYARWDPEDEGAGIWCENASPTFVNCTLTDTHADDKGGAAYILDCSTAPVFDSCVFRDIYSGGKGTIHSVNSLLTVKNSEFYNNVTNAWDAHGTGIYGDSNSDLTVDNCYFTGHSNNHGAADGVIRIDGGTLTLSNSLFEQNNMSSEAANGVYLSLASGTISSCSFVDCSTGAGGVAITLNNSSPTVSDCRIADLSATTDGPAVSIYNGSSPTFSNCLFENNNIPIATDGHRYGGAIKCNGAGIAVSFTDCRFVNNALMATGQQHGGAIAFVNGAAGTISRCFFMGNRAMTNNDPAQSNNGRGGALFFGSSTATHTIENSVFSGNSTNQYGGGAIAIDDNNSMTIRNCTFANNSHVNGGNGGGAVYTSGQSIALSIVNSIFWGNTAEGNGGDQLRVASGTVNIDHSCVQAGEGGINGTTDYTSAGTNNDYLPRFTDADGTDNTTGTIDDDLSLKATSYVVNQGTNTGAPAVDIDNQPRPYESTTDMGAYELQEASQAGPMYVKWDATGDNDGSSWADAMTDLGEAIWATPPNRDLWVAQGTYKPSLQYDGTTTTNERNRAFTLRNNRSLYGGFQGTETSLSQRNFHSYKTILSGDNNSNNTADYTDASNGDCIHVLEVRDAATDATAILDGVVIQYAYNTDGNGTNDNDQGAGMYINSGSPTIRNTTVENCLSKSGSGLYIELSNSLIDSCVWQNNTCTGQGGAIWINNADPNITANSFRSNEAQGQWWGGGAVYMTNGATPSIQNSYFEDNITTGSFGSYGGAVYSIESSPDIANCVFVNNRSSQGGSGGGGGALAYNVSGGKVVNCTFANNYGDYGGAILLFFRNYGSQTNVAVSPQIFNNILWNNAASQASRGHQLCINEDNAEPQFFYNDIKDGYTGIRGSGSAASWAYAPDQASYDAYNNIAADPLFVSAYNDLSLQAASPCLAAGDPSTADSHYPQDGSSEPIDFLGNPRFYKQKAPTASIDMGAYEYQKHVWHGSVDTDWNNSSNWSAGSLPDATTDVVILASASKQPESNNATGAAAEAKARELLIETGAHLYIAENKSLTLSGELINNGELRLLSPGNSGVAGSFIDNGTMSGSGSQIVERFLSREEWHYISAPVDNYDIHQLTPVAGNNLYQFTEEDYSWQRISSSTPMQNMQGYIIYSHYYKLLFEGNLRSNLQEVAVSYGSSAPEASKQGWNLVGNPYPSSIDADQFLTDDDIENTLYLYDAGLGYGTSDVQNYRYYNYSGGGSDPYGISVNAATSTIPPCQAFFVRATNSGSDNKLSINNNARLHGSQNFYKTQEKIPDDYIRLELQYNDYRDQTVIRFMQNATTGYDTRFDAYKLWSSSAVMPQIYAITTNEQADKLALNSLPVSDSQTRIPLGIKAGGSGQYKLTINNIKFPEDTKVYLKDHNKADQLVLLSPGKQYVFNSEAGDFDERFELLLYPGLMTELDQPEKNNTSHAEDLIKIYAQKRAIFIKVPQKLLTNNTVEVHDVSGCLQYHGQINKTHQKIDLQLNAGIYIVSFKHHSCKKTQRVVLNN